MIYPVKSFDPVSTQRVDVLPSGALRHDRQFALVDSTGKFINAKRTALVHRIHLVIDPVNRNFVVANRDQETELIGRLDDGIDRLSEWLTKRLQIDVSIIENEETGFPDDLEAPGPTIVSTATLDTVASWFPGSTVEEMRLRFRANIEVDGVEPFWEDRLFGADATSIPFRIGPILFGGMNPCRRCVVPTRNPLTGEISPQAFAKTFQEKREESLPLWAARERFDHFYRLTTNTRKLGKETGAIQVGDSVELDSFH